MYHPRLLEQKLQLYLKRFRAVALTGPRQAGKSTLLKALLPNYRYVNFDDQQLCDWFLEDPEDFMTRHSAPVIFDEAQKVPGIFHRGAVAF